MYIQREKNDNFTRNRKCQKYKIVLNNYTNFIKNIQSYVIFKTYFMNKSHLFSRYRFRIKLFTFGEANFWICVWKVKETDLSGTPVLILHELCLFYFLIRKKNQTSSCSSVHNYFYIKFPLTTALKHISM